MHEDRLDEEVTLVPYDSSWPAAFAAERDRLTTALPRADVLEHIGSTAVPGMRAKPVIDMMLGLPTLADARAYVPRLVALGYENLGEAGVPGRIYLRLRGPLSFNLHLMEHGGGHWTSNLALRDLLRADAQVRERYARAKQEAIDAGATRLLAYSAAKQQVLGELLELARGR